MPGETKELPGIKIKYPASIDFAAMVDQLAQPGAFPFALSESEAITVLQTHASAVVLTPSRVYKVKKPKNFGFLNFSTPLLRRHFCEQEVRLNTPRALHIYLGVAPILLFSDGRFRFGPTCPPSQVPLPGSSLAGGLVVDYAVVMVRLPEKATLEAHVRGGTADALLLAEIAQFVAAAHLQAATSEDIASFGSAAKSFRFNLMNQRCQQRSGKPPARKRTHSLGLPHTMPAARSGRPSSCLEG